MVIQSHRLGSVDVEETAVFAFPKPLLGFERHEQFALIRPDAATPFAYLQAIDNPSVSFLLADPFAFDSSYEFELPEEEIERLSNVKPEELAVWVTVSARESLRDATMNLLAPLVFNTAQQVASQVVLHNSSYKTKVPMFPRPEEE
ncbi:flagellar assembly protein FliW [Tumebacillus flagellatus]|uniref:Flagellar assembly factor FliW n=1 Tax=Tumebacillus flagellatus TaxID=1157490 RepID=A0A074LSH4_9BACL|nr:flagellar assembly protein FliW [Tumebacillus flagellatus]KEO84069.1 hypothetical protein EL26_06290 [Tumebacillus flagellatus]